MADPAMAPMTAGPAPVRNDSTERVGSDPVEVAAADEDEDERRGEGDQRGQQPAADSPGRVADHGHGLDDRARGDLAEGDGVQELGAGHPVVGGDGVVLHERDDDEPAAVGEGADLEGHPGQRPESADRSTVERRRAGRTPEPNPVTSVGPARRTRISVTPHARSTSTRYGPTVAAAAPPTRP